MAMYGVLLPLFFDDVFDYNCDDDNLKVGQLVVVPFGRETHVGVIWKIGQSADIEAKKIKKLQKY